MSNIQVDLQAVSIDPLKPQIRVGSQTTVKVVMKNNGPGVIPAKGAVFQVTVDGKFAYKPTGVRAINSSWALKGHIIKKDGRYDLFFQNTKPIEINNSDNLEQVAFNVRGKKPGKVYITVASSLSDTPGDVSDGDGNNQSVTTEIIVK